MGAEKPSDHRFQDNAWKLRSPERVAMMEPGRVVELSLRAESIGSVLDIGTGTGLFAEAFWIAGPAVTGMDANPEFLDEAGRHATDVSFVEGSAENLPFLDDSFDLVFMACLLHEVDDPRHVLEEAARTAKKRVAVLEWPFREDGHGPPLAHRLSPSRIEGLARDAGLLMQEHVVLEHVELYIMVPDPAVS